VSPGFGGFRGSIRSIINGPMIRPRDHRMACGIACWINVESEMNENEQYQPDWCLSEKHMPKPLAFKSLAVTALCTASVVLNAQGPDVWSRLPHRSGWILLGEIQLLVSGGKVVGLGEWESRHFRSILQHTNKPTRKLPSIGDHLVLRQPCRVFVAGFRGGDTERWQEPPLTPLNALYETDSDTGLDLPTGASVKVEEVRRMFLNTAGLNTVVARVRPVE
jgi:hypothetical protein